MKYCSILLALSWFVCVGPVVADQPANGELQWKLSEEFRGGADKENPNADAREYPTWHFLRTTRSEGPIETRRWLRDGRYVPLGEKGERLFGLPFDGWIFRGAASAESPVVSRATEENAAGLSVKRGDLVVAPGPEHATVIGWRSPAAGKLEMHGFFEHVQASSGVTWYVERGPAPNVERGFEPVSLRSGRLVFGTAAQKAEFHIQDQSVQPGEYVYFIVDAQADGTASPHPGDGTRFDVTISLAGAIPPAVPQFETDVLPILTARCVHCHDSKSREGRLQLETVSSLLAGGSNGPAVVAGSPEQSLLVERVQLGEMPPGKNERLSTEEVAVLRRWIKAGLPARETIRPVAGSLFTEVERQHWAFQPLSLPSVPAVRGADQALTPIDRFLLARLEGNGLSFSQPADRTTWLRRVTFDMTGLPPTSEELAQFEQDQRPKAYEQTVDRLLGSPQFGVRWGRHWLDIVGYTDTVSFDEDFGAPIGFLDGKWRYRDYVIDAFNADKPYDQFVLEQLAGDELVDWRNATEYSPEIIEKLVATGFLRTAEDISVEDPRPFVIWSTVHETLEQTATSLLGVTLQCARCHSHKFEPIPQRDYYSLMALFTPALNPQNWKNARNRLLPDVAAPVLAEIQKHNGEIDRQVGEVQQQIDAVRRGYEQKLREEKLQTIPEPIRADLKAALDLPADKQDVVQKYLVGKLGPLMKIEPAAIDAALNATDRELLQQRSQQIAALNGKKRTHGWIHSVYDVGPPPAAQIFKRGEFETPGRQVPPGFLRVLSDPRTEALLAAAQPPGTSGRRTALARWITAADSPASGLASRVMVNRIWQQLFGRGLAVTSENLGLSGSPPTHPELLDWLASDFRANGWKFKRVIRQIVLSAAYRQSSAVRQVVGPGGPSPAMVDPENTLLWRMPLRRLDAESLRDAIAFFSGKLDNRLSGLPIPLVYDLKTRGVSEEELTAVKPVYRRSVYLVNRRLYNPTLLSQFDKPTVTGGVCRRDQSSTALQSLSLMNDRFLIANAERFAGLVRDQAGKSSTEQIEVAYRLALSRPPDNDEREWSAELLVKQAELFRQAGHSGEEAARRALANFCQTLWGTNDFLYLR